MARVVTLEIDTNAIRLMEASGGRIVRWATLSLESDMFEEGVISDPVALSNAVKQLMNSSGITGKDVTASVSSLYSVSRILTVSNLPGGGTTREAVLESAREIMPLAMDKLYLSWQTVATSENEHRVLMLGVPQDVIDAEIQALKATGINPRILVLKTMALARAVNKEQALILNIELSSFDIIMVVSSVPEIMRSIAWQQDNLTVEDKAEHLALTLELTVSFYNSQHPDAPLSRDTPLFITGQMSGDATLMEKLRARVGYSIEPLAPPLEYPSHMPVSQYAVNIGLALKGTASSKNLGQGGYLPPDINLLPDSYKPWKPSARQAYFACGILAALALLFILYQVTTAAMSETADLQAEYNIIKSELQLRQIEIKNREPLQKAIAEYRTIVEMGGGFTEDLQVINGEAERLGVEVQSIRHEGKAIALTCEADNFTAFRDYLTALEESGRFSTPIPPPEGYPYTTSGDIRLESIPGE